MSAINVSINLTDLATLFSSAETSDFYHKERNDLAEKVRKLTAELEEAQKARAFAEGERDTLVEELNGRRKTLNEREIVCMDKLRRLADSINLGGEPTQKDVDLLREAANIISDRGDI